jgi:hypothetical protein
MNGVDPFKDMIERECRLEEGLRDEFEYAEVATVLAELAGAPAGQAVQHVVSGGVLRFRTAGMTEKVINRLVNARTRTLVVRAVADFIAFIRSQEDNYKSCCRSALCHAKHGSWEWAFGALRAAAHKDDTWARHHHIRGLIHGARGDFEKAVTELARAAAAEPYPDASSRISEALELARSKVSIHADPGATPDPARK